MRMYAARFGRLLPDGQREPHAEDLVAFYSKPPLHAITKRHVGGEDIDYYNPGDADDPEAPRAETWGDTIPYARWLIFGPELVPGTIREFDFCIVIERRDAVLGVEDT